VWRGTTALSRGLGFGRFAGHQDALWGSGRIHVHHRLVVSTGSHRIAQGEEAERPNINGGSPVALLLNGVGLLFWFSNKDTLKCSGMSPATGIL
jgi:hypothetical protein